MHVDRASCGIGRLLYCSKMVAEPFVRPVSVRVPDVASNYGYHNARIGMMKNVLPQHMQNTATARMSSLYSLLETVGPVLSGGLLLLSALHNVFLLIAGMYVLAFWQLNKLEFKPSAPVVQQSVLSALKEGWLILYANKNMWHITLVVMVINTTGAIFWIQAIYFA